jgi:hypothetical protein
MDGMRGLPLLLFWIAAWPAVSATVDAPVVFTGMCDASAAAVVSGDLLAVANDEDNVLRFYRTSRPGPPIHACDLAPLLGLKRKAELDLEGAARLGTNFFWITSHGQNKAGEYTPNRHRLFALAIAEGPEGPSVRLVGEPFAGLVSAMAADPRLARFELDRAARRLPKDGGGLNIEALTDTAEGTLLVGFRNPIPEGRALIVPLLNPHELMTGSAPRFGDPVLLDLKGLGLRGMGSTAGGYFLIGGPTGGTGDSHLFRWNGRSDAPEIIPEASLQGLNPEAISFHDMGDGDKVLLLSDDGAREVNGVECKDLPGSERRFRAHWCRIAPWNPDR